jgi:hypothetical protein
VFESATPRRMSRGARCALFGVAMTLLARLGPWSWPGWPALTLLDFVLARYAPSVASPMTKAFGAIVLLFVNVGFWAVLAWAVLKLRDAVTR